jgi:hypothetical protein
MTFLTKLLVLFFICVSPSLACDTEAETATSISGKGSTESILARTVFNRISPESVDIDAAAKKAYGCRYVFADVFGGLEKAQPIAGGLPEAPSGPDGLLLSGKVLIAYIISVDGLAADPVVIESTDPRLTDVALRAMQSWRFKPASFNGRVVATLAAQDFPFGSHGP